MGLGVPAVMRTLAARFDLMDVRIFSNALGIHRQAGGNLAVMLERLAAVIRDRMDYHRHLKSVTGAGRLSVMLVLALGPILFTYLFFLQPEYGQSLWKDSLGRGMLVFAAISQTIGLVWVMRVLRRDY
jgi:tight adherence protein B